MEKIFKIYYKCSIGLIEIAGNEEGILSLNYEPPGGFAVTPVAGAAINDNLESKNLDSAGSNLPPVQLPKHMTDCIDQLEEYFAGKRKEFRLRLITRGTDFQQIVWNELLKIPYGKTYSYRDVAEKSGNVKAVRAVGNANNKNKIAIIIPCHRVIGSNNKLIGYAGGLWRKQWLLNHEQKMSRSVQ